MNSDYLCNLENPILILPSDGASFSQSSSQQVANQKSNNYSSSTCKWRKNAPAPASVYHTAKKAMQTSNSTMQKKKISPSLGGKESFVHLLPNNLKMNSSFECSLPLVTTTAVNQQPTFPNQSCSFSHQPPQITTATIDQVFSPVSSSNAATLGRNAFQCGCIPPATAFHSQTPPTAIKGKKLSKKSFYSLSGGGSKRNLHSNSSSFVFLESSSSSSNNLIMQCKSPQEKASELKGLLSDISLENSTVLQLKSLAKQFGIPRCGKKIEIFQRLHAADEAYFAKIADGTTNTNASPSSSFSQSEIDQFASCLLGNDAYLPKCIPNSLEPTPKIPTLCSAPAHLSSTLQPPPSTSSSNNNNATNLAEFEKILTLSPLSSFLHFDLSSFGGGAASNGGQSENAKEDASIYNFLFKNSSNI